MSHFIASIHAYDVMSHVYVVVDVRDVDRQNEEGGTAVYHAQTTFPGVGESDPRHWLEDVLVGLMEVG